MFGRLFLVFPILIVGTIAFPSLSIPDEFEAQYQRVVGPIVRRPKITAKPTTQEPTTTEGSWDEDSQDLTLSTPLTEQISQDVKKALELIRPCVKDLVQKNKTIRQKMIGSQAFTNMLNAMVYCLNQNNFSDVALYMNMGIATLDLAIQSNVTCEIEELEMIEFEEDPIFKVSAPYSEKDQRKMCQATNKLQQMYCQVEKKCPGQQFNAVATALMYSGLHFEANGGLNKTDKCPAKSSSIGRAINPKAYEPDFDLNRDKIFRKNLCRRS